MAPFAIVSLLSSDSYLPGALAQVAALRELHPDPPVVPEVPFQTVCLVTPETVDVASIKRLRKVYDQVIGVEILQQDNPAGLNLLGTLDNRRVFRIHARESAHLPARPQAVLTSPLSLRSCMYFVSPNFQKSFSSTQMSSQSVPFPIFFPSRTSSQLPQTSVGPIFLILVFLSSPQDKTNSTSSTSS